MSILDFEKFNFKDLLNGIKENPERLLFGSADPFSTKLWNKILNRDDEPLINQFGGPTDEAFQRAEAEGIDTGTSKKSHNIAKTIAGIYGGAGLFNAFGGGLGGGSGGGSSAISEIPASEYAPLARSGSLGGGGFLSKAGGFLNSDGGQAAMNILPSLMGGSQPAPAAPAYQPGMSQGVSTPIQTVLPSRVNNDQLSALTASKPGSQNAEVGPPEEIKQDKSIPEAFFGSLNESINDPAKLLILGLLNNVGDKRYGTLGLLGKGIFDTVRRNGQ